MTEITHADQLTMTEFKKLIGATKTRVLIGVSAVIAAIIGLVAAGPVIGVIALLGVAAIGVGIAYFMADNRAEDAFYDAYAKSRGLKRTDGNIGQASPLLRKGDERSTDEMFTGQLAEGVNGSLALYTYTEVSYDSDGDRQETDYPFTVVTTQLPELSKHIAEMAVHRKSGFKAFEKLEDAFRGNLKRVKLESAALDDRFEIFTDEDTDPIWVRQLFSPSFIVWLTEFPVKNFAFEFDTDKLVAFVPKHRDSSDGFNEMIDATCELAGKLKAEVKEG